MNGVVKYLPGLFAFLLLACGTASKNSNNEESKPVLDTLVSLENNSFQLTFSLWGGALVKFQDKTAKINPFNWKQAKGNVDDNQDNAILQGQYLSVGRWTLPTPGELKLGMPPNGEPVNNWWKLESKKGSVELNMNCEAPLDGYSITRNVVLSQSDPLFRVSETFTNDFSIGRVCTIVQNVVLTAPFFEESVNISTNATLGFNQELALPDLCEHEYRWPKAFIDTLQISTTDLSKFSNRFRYNSSLIFSDSIGWIAVYNPKLKLLLGYVWKTRDYPWLHIRNEVYYSKPDMHGLSFGTTGLDDRFSFEDRITTTFHKVRNFDFIDAKSTLTKTWYCFLINSPSGYEKVSDISFQDDRIVVQIATSLGTKEIKLGL